MDTKSAREVYQQASIIMFDFDGIIVDSNQQKSDCFLELATPFGESTLVRLEYFLSKHPFATRFEVVAFMLEDPKVRSSCGEGELLKSFSSCSKSKIMKMRVSPGLASLRIEDDRPWALISATEQADLQEITAVLEIQSYFQAGIFGSPRSKTHHITHLRQKLDIEPHEAVLIGDRLSDKSAAEQAGARFIFISEWSDASPEDLAHLRSSPSAMSLSRLLRDHE